MQPPVKPEFQLVLAVHLVECGRQLACILTEPVVAVGIRAGARAAVVRIGIYINGGHPRESIALQIRWKSQLSERIVNAVRVVGVDVPHASREAEGHIQQ